MRVLLKQDRNTVEMVRFSEVCRVSGTASAGLVLNKKFTKKPPDISALPRGSLALQGLHRSTEDVSPKHLYSAAMKSRDVAAKL